MKIFDTHCHIADPAFDADLPEVIERFHAAGICRVNVVADPCEETPNQEKVFRLVEANDGFCAAIGAHPHNASRYDEAAEAEILKYLAHPECRLLGEIGLDYHYDLSPRDVQRDVFARQLEIAWQQKMPVQLHIREAHGDTMDIVRGRMASGTMPEGIMHCYTGSWEAAKVYLDAGLYISFSGALTFKNAPKLVEVMQNMPADRILIETDCPYMAPVPLRGRRNEPAFLAHTLARAAEIRGISPERFAAQIYENSLRIFRLQDEEV